jgi:hypothetical protein
VVMPVGFDRGFLGFTHAEQVYARGSRAGIMGSTAGCFPQREKWAGGRCLDVGGG